MTITEQPSDTLNQEHRRPDHTARWVALAAALLSVGTYIYFFTHGMALGYKDSISHLQIAARTLNSPTAGAAQLGGVWLPLPHILMLPFIWSPALYFSGFAGSIVSMVGYVIACVYVYKVVFALTNDRIPALAGTFVFMLSPNVLYMQSTSMTEPLLLASLAAMTYYLQRWIQTDDDHDRQYPYLFAAGIAATVGCLVRYEAWVITIVFSGIVLFVALRRYDLQKAFGVTLSYLFCALFGITLWFGWNLLIFGNPLNFQIGEYSKPSLWVGENEPSVGHPLVAIKTYWYAMESNLGIVLLLTMIAGSILCLVARKRLDMLPTFGLLSIIPFFMLALYGGQRPLHVTEISGDLYNVRFGLLVILPAAIIIGCMLGLLPKRVWVSGAIAAVAITLLPLIPHGPTQVVTAREGSIGFPQTALDASSYLKQHYDGGVILAESFGNESILFYAEIMPSTNVYEGSYRKWNPALSNPPGQQIRWIVMRGGSAPDHTYNELHETSKLSEYQEVFDNDRYTIYKRKV